MQELNQWCPTVCACVRSAATALGAVQILQLGTLPLLGALFNLWLEGGLAAALVTLFRQFIAGGLLFYIFRCAGQVGACAHPSPRAARRPA
jgi:hypothetical protein